MLRIWFESFTEILSLAILAGMIGFWAAVGAGV